MSVGLIATLLLLACQPASAQQHSLDELMVLLQETPQFRNQRCDYVVITKGDTVKDQYLREFITGAHNNLTPVMIASLEGLKGAKNTAKLTSQCSFFITDMFGEEFNLVASDVREGMFVVAKTENKEDLKIGRWVERSFAVQERKTNKSFLYCHNAQAGHQWKPVGTNWPVCRHPLEGKILKIGCHGYMPGVIFPKKKGGRVAGIEPNLMYIIAEKFKFKPQFRLSAFDIYRNGSWSMGSKMAQLLDGSIDLGMGSNAMLFLQSRFIEVGYPIYNIEGFWGHRYPIPRRDFLKVTKVFTYGIWLWIFASIFAMSVAFILLHTVYARNKEMAHLSQPLLRSKFEYFFATFCALLDKTRIGWFPEWSAGRFLVLLWSAYSMANVFFYESTLRSYLIAEDYEKPIDSHKDLLERGETVYIADNLMMLRYDISENPAYAASWDPDALAVFQHAKKTGGYFNLAKNKYKLPTYAVNDIHENGASFFTADNVYPYGWFGDKRLGIPNIREGMSKLRFYKYPIAGGYARKGNPFLKDLNHMWSWLRDMGFVQKFLWEPLPLEATLHPKEPTTLEPLSFEFMWTPLFCIFIGYVLATISFLRETRCMKKHTENVDRTVNVATS